MTFAIATSYADSLGVEAIVPMLQASNHTIARIPLVLF